MTLPSPASCTDRSACARLMPCLAHLPWLGILCTPTPHRRAGGGRARAGAPHLFSLLKNQMMSNSQHDPVNHPSHYTGHASGVECIQVTEHMNFCLGNAVKYIWRAGLKSDSPVEDLRKARWYIEREIARLTMEKTK